MTEPELTISCYILIPSCCDFKHHCVLCYSNNNTIYSIIFNNTWRHDEVIVIVWIEELGSLVRIPVKIIAFIYIGKAMDVSFPSSYHDSMSGCVNPRLTIVAMLSATKSCFALRPMHKPFHLG